jgi:hypothetical protein
VAQRSERITHQDGRDVRSEFGIPRGATAGTLPGADEEVAKQKNQKLLRQQKAGPLLQLV